jgi:hypothetical protein
MDADSFHRLAKLLLDTGEAASIAQALDTFGRYGVRIHLTPGVIHDVGRQILALTAINCAARSFQGNVLIEGSDFEIIAPGFQGTRLYAFLEWAGVKSQVPMAAAGWPRIIVHGERTERRDLVAWSAGWEFGIGASPRAAPVFAPACVVAAGLALNEAFSILREDNPYAGHRRIRLSLWDPTSGAEARSGPLEVPRQEALWLIGLGHLGQAYAWTLGFLRAGSQSLVLQDIDLVSESTLSTSMVSHSSDRGQKKTRVVARWPEARGYQTALVERRFDETHRVRPEEPGTALFGLDNAAARRVIEAGGSSRDRCRSGCGLQRFSRFAHTRVPRPVDCGDTVGIGRRLVPATCTSLSPVAQVRRRAVWSRDAGCPCGRRPICRVCRCRICASGAHSPTDRWTPLRLPRYASAGTPAYGARLKSIRTADRRMTA